MTATTAPSCTHYQDIHSTILLMPTRCHPTAHSHRRVVLVLRGCGRHGG
ncbi:hypothetical protein ACWCQP_32730 [Streptomyces chartreusis]